MAVEQTRPKPLREYDQIPMRSEDLLRQVKLIAPRLAGKRVVFVGDFDCSALMLAISGRGGVPSPQAMLVLDFDDRLLSAVDVAARRYDVANLLSVRRYNVFDPVPSDLLGEFDWFYTNPPYGSRNNGKSAQLFVTRGCELTRDVRASGCAILPYDDQRKWTRLAMLGVQRFLARNGWTVRTMLEAMHRYHLDDDPDLTSALLLIDKVRSVHGRSRLMPYAGRKVVAAEIPCFYGRGVPLPFPSHILRTGERGFGAPVWSDVRS